MIITCTGERPGGTQAEPQLMVEIIMPLSGTLRVNPLYKEAMQDATTGQKESLREDMDRASLFVKCLQQRNHTIQRLMQRIVSAQRAFIIHGEKYMRPITRVQLAHELEVHESTISRAVSNKAVQMPNGRIIPLSNFFDRSMNVRTVLREMIDEEPYPLSDSELAGMLGERGFQVARRTVAKYRAMEGILPANLRHNGSPTPERAALGAK
jgi:RNA polymerase sigma-54 factor